MTVEQQSNTTYQDYYMRAINQQLQADDFGGLKLMVGPTGLGKTYAIPFVIQELRQRGVDKGCIYSTHRHILLEELHLFADTDFALTSQQLDVHSMSFSSSANYNFCGS